MILACGATPPIPSGTPGGGGGTSGSSGCAGAGSPGPFDGSSGGGGGGGGGGGAGLVSVIGTGEGGGGRTRRAGRHRSGHRSTLGCSGDQRRHDGAVRVAVHQPVAAHDVVAAGCHR